MAVQVTTQRKRRSLALKRLEQAVPMIKERYGVKRIGLFGSFARGEQTRKSDVDVLVEFSEGQATLYNIVHLADHLEAMFKRRVDLLTVGGIDKYIRPRVEGEVIWVEG
jgi:predicted nucleotidyltransferase